MTPEPLDIYVQDTSGWTPLDVKPATAAPIVPVTPRNPPRTVNPSPWPTASDSRLPSGYSPLDYGTDRAGRPLVVSDPGTGRPAWNPALETLSDDEMLDFIDQANARDAVSGYAPRGRRPQQIGSPQEFLADAAVGALYDYGLPIADWLGAQAGQGVANLRDTLFPNGEPTIQLPNGDRVGLIGYYPAGGSSPIEQGNFEGDILIPGGQSPGVSYRYSLRIWQENDKGRRFFTTPSNRPIAGTAPGPLRFSYRARSDGGEVWEFFDGNGNRLSIVSGIPPDYAHGVHSFHIERADGQPDTGGNFHEPIQAPVPTQPHQPTDFTDPEAPTAPPIGLPEFPDLLPDIGSPFGDNPEGQPEAEPIVPTIPDLPEAPELPGIDADGDGQPDSPGGGSGNNGNGNGDENLSCCEKIDAIHGYFQVSGQESIDLAECGANGADLQDWEGTGLTGVYRALETLSTATQRLWDSVKCGSDIAIPEWWAVRPGADVPQLAITFKAEDSNSKWSLTIPHYNKPESFVVQIPKYTKGSYFTTLTLTDNTKLVINAKSFSEGERVVNALVPVIDPAYLTSPLNLHQGKRKGASLTQAVVIATRAAFYPKGQQSNRPEWYAKIKVV